MTHSHEGRAHSYVCHGPTRGTHVSELFIHMNDITQSHERLDSFTCVTELFIHMNDIAQSHELLDSFICVSWTDS